MNADQRLAGWLQVRPGRGRPHSLSGTRRVLAGPVLAGQPAAAVPRLLGSLFALCGHAHVLCATLALAAAHGQDAPASAAQQRALQVGTARDHALRLCLDWPGLLGRHPAHGAGTVALQASLHGLPAWDNGLAFANDAGEWLGRLLGVPPAAWLAAWERDPACWLARWCERENGWLPALLQSCRPFAQRPLEAAPPLRPHAGPADLHALALAMAGDFDTTAPAWRGACAETGSWTRLHGTAHTGMPPNAWERLGARIAELARLVLPDAPGRSGAGWLSSGAMSIGPGEGLGWVEMARGLLVHRARIDDPAGASRVAGYDVLAPTDWNFHSQGAVARALETMAAERADTPACVRVLMAAYDPCVRFEIEARPTTITECLHA